MEDSPKWFVLAREVFSLSQAGLAYSKNEYDIQRYQRLKEISAEMLVSQSDLLLGDVLKSFSIQQGYATPKIDVRAAVIRDQNILLVKEKADGRWSMPGGWGDIGDAPAAMVAREVWEESGFRVSVDKLLAVYDGNRLQPYEFYHSYKLIFSCSIQSGKPTPSIETLDVDFFSMDALPPLSEKRTSRRMLDEVFAHHHDPHRATFFE